MQSGPRGGVRRQTLPIRWDDLPHEDLWRRALEIFGFGSPQRAREDVVRGMLRARLSRLDPAQHWRYLEGECVFIVEMLRILRDLYRKELADIGCKPVSEVYWVVFRFVLVPKALKILREATFLYVTSTRVDPDGWRRLYGYGPYTAAEIMSVMFGEGDAACYSKGPPKTPQEFADLVRDAVDSEVSEDALLEIGPQGGPFGRETQPRRARRSPWPDTLSGNLSILQEIERRHQLWDSVPWTEGLTILFDAVQAEIVAQANALPEDGRRAELEYVNLSEFQKIAYTHLRQMRQSMINQRSFSDDQWLKVARDLDQRQVRLDDALSGRSKQVLIALRKRHTLDTWEACLTCTGRTSLETSNGTFGLRREVRRAIHNAASSASSRLEKVWATRQR
jgi:hypothetical protein